MIEPVPAQRTKNGVTELRYFALSVKFMAERTLFGAFVMPIDPMPYILHTWDRRMLT